MKKSITPPPSFEDIRVRILRSFATIAIISSFSVFFAFSLWLVWQSNLQVGKQLELYQSIVERHYRLSPTNVLTLSDNIHVYFEQQKDVQTLPEENLLELDTIAFSGENLLITESRSFYPDIIAYHFSFVDQGKRISAYIAMDTVDDDAIIDSWDVLMIAAMVLMFSLITILRFALKRVFIQLMVPITSLIDQLNNKAETFSLSDDSVTELQQLAAHLNHYSRAKESLARQELMFANYASHELKTPISVIIGTTELLEMKLDDREFQQRQRARILEAANGMKATVGALLNIVKQENPSAEKLVTHVNELSIDLSHYKQMLPSGLHLSLSVEPNTVSNLPVALINIVIKNYVENALRFTTKGEIKVTVDSNTISVMDTGSGLTNEANVEHGLGLIIVDRIGKSYDWESTLINRKDGQRGCIASFARIL